MRRSLLVVIIVSALAIIGVIVYLARPRADETDNAQLHENPVPAQSAPQSGGAPSAPAPGPASAPSALASCVGPTTNPQTPIANLAARHRWADSLLTTNHLDGALTELRNIATLDPGYPAINLDISDALLKSKHASDARDAINLQLEISRCLANLPQSDLLAYCRSEWESVPQGGCIPELDRINQKAHYQAGVIDTELAPAAQPHPAPAAPATAAAKVSPRPLVAPAASTASVVQSAPKNSPEVAAEVTPPPPPPPPKIKTAEASGYIGQKATVCGAIAGKHTAEDSNGKPTFVNFDHIFPDPGFTAVIWATDGPAVGDFPGTGSVCVTGTIASYRGSPEIVVHDAKSWYKSDQP